MKSTLLALVVGLALAITLACWHWTAAPIAEAEHQWERQQWLAALPVGGHDNDPLQSPLPVAGTQLAHSQLLSAYRATLAGKPVAVVLRSQARGYAGPLQLAIAIDNSGRLLGTRVLEQHETPGLGGQLADPQHTWQEQFTRRDLNARWALKRDQGDFDQLAGATVTSRGVIDALQDALRYFDTHRQALLQEPLDD
ncbi:MULTISPECIES: RnfABCDGE type electron transport complex subunit G [unclassified Pseudomonas]|uniref:RnfABCDGE type electron transport complex subunit G n=1 Tax=unclassified Pseudomonas TaxID=196821 RepID=UPI0035BEC1BA